MELKYSIAPIYCVCFSVNTIIIKQIHHPFDVEVDLLPTALAVILNQLDELMTQNISELSIMAWVTREPVPFANRRSGERNELKIGDKWGELFDCAWFKFSCELPEELPDNLVAKLDISGELCVVDATGIPIRGLTNISSIFDRRLGEPGKKLLPIAEVTNYTGKQLEFWADAGCNDLFGYLQDEGRIIEASLAVLDTEVKSLYYDFETILDLINNIKNFKQSHINLEEIEAVLVSFDSKFSTMNEIKQLRDILFTSLQFSSTYSDLRISAIGHSHIDLAWLWPIRETKRKGIRTFATAVAEMRNYPNYTYGASQPQLYQWIKDEQPELYLQIKEQVSQGKIEPLGAFWVESDVNLISGESVIRQILYGQKFWQEEFGLTINFAWLPDSFGYPASLPQIFRDCGLKYFVTQKLSWNLVNKFPYHSFHWHGIDGTPILAHLLPEETYNGPALPRSLLKIADNYSQADVSTHALMVYGIGDGGGGPGIEHLERLQRLNHINGMNDVKQQRVGEFFENWRHDQTNFPHWQGELYLERHQGTYTTNTKNKWYNRRVELMLRDWEILQACYAMWVASDYLHEYPKEELDYIWKEILLYQFHDVLPGSSIKRVYDESRDRYAIILSEIHLSIDRLLKLFGIGAKGHYLIYNSLSWLRVEWIKFEDTWQKVKIDPLSLTCFTVEQYNKEFDVGVEYNQLENKQLCIKFGSSGAIISIYDKEQQREIIAPNEMANTFAIYNDDGNAWDFPPDYTEQVPECMTLASTTTEHFGPRAMIIQTYQYGSSILTQRISLTENDRLLEFDTELDWHESKKMLRVDFPVNIFSPTASYDIQFGHINRPTHDNTSWDRAKIEVVGQKWVDISQYDYGVALLNDSKYGHRIKNHTISLHLLRSVPYAGYNTGADQVVAVANGEFITDIGSHQFRYGLLPHQGDYKTGMVNRRAYEFNIPLKIVPNLTIIKPQSLLSIDQDSIVVDTIKISEDREGVILRCYESHAGSCSTTIQFNLPLTRIEEVNALEEYQDILEIDDQNRIVLDFRPFELKTIKIYPVL